MPNPAFPGEQMMIYRNNGHVSAFDLTVNDTLLCRLLIIQRSDEGIQAREHQHRDEHDGQPTEHEFRRTSRHLRIRVHVWIKRFPTYDGSLIERIEAGH